MSTDTQNGTNGTPTQSAMVRTHAQNDIQPRNAGELRDLGKDAADSGFFGVNQSQAIMLMRTGFDLGLSYTQSLRMFHVIKGKASLSADGAVAVCKQHQGKCEYFRPIKQTATEATWETKPVGGEPVSYTFTIKDAEAAGLTTNDMYRKYPTRMLSARAKGYLARDVYPELLAGLYDPDELQNVAAPYTASTPVRAEVVRTDIDDEQIAKGFVDAIHAATTLEALQGIAKDIKSAPLSDDSKAALKGIYGTRQKEIKAGPASEPKAAE